MRWLSRLVNRPPKLVAGGLEGEGGDLRVGRGQGVDAEGGVARPAAVGQGLGALAAHVGDDQVGGEVAEDLLVVGDLPFGAVDEEPAYDGHPGGQTLGSRIGIEGELVEVGSVYEW
jgi:hypothetical protein